MMISANTALPIPPAMAALVAKKGGGSTPVPLSLLAAIARNRVATPARRSRRASKLGARKKNNTRPTTPRPASFARDRDPDPQRWSLFGGRNGAGGRRGWGLRHGHGSRNYGSGRCGGRVWLGLIALLPLDLGGPELSLSTFLHFRFLDPEDLREAGRVFDPDDELFAFYLDMELTVAAFHLELSDGPVADFVFSRFRDESTGVDRQDRLKTVTVVELNRPVEMRHVDISKSQRHTFRGERHPNPVLA